MPVVTDLVTVFERHLDRVFVIDFVMVLDMNFDMILVRGFVRPLDTTPRPVGQQAGVRVWEENCGRNNLERASIW